MPATQRISENCAENFIEISGYKNCLWKQIIFYTFCILTGGILFVVVYFKPSWYAFANGSLCTLDDAEFVVVSDSHETVERHNVTTVTRGTATTQLRISVPSTDGTKYEETTRARVFKYRKLTYVWHPKERLFKQVATLDVGATVNELRTLSPGLTRIESNARRILHGENTLDIALTPLYRLIAATAFSPFYVFQIFSVTVWLIDGYVYYAMCIFAMSFASIALDVYQTRRQQVKTMSLCTSSRQAVECLRDNEWVTLATTDLVPGDVVRLGRECQKNVLQCDGVIIGGGCIVDESQLTGECVPVTKTSLPFDGLIDEEPNHGDVQRPTSIDGLYELRTCSMRQGEKYRLEKTMSMPSEEQAMLSQRNLKSQTAALGEELMQHGSNVDSTNKSNLQLSTKLPNNEEMYSTTTHAQHTLFSGSKVLQLKDCMLLVTRTAFYTVKGTQIRAIMYPHPSDFRLARDLLVMICLLACIASIGVIYTFYVLTASGATWWKTLIRALDIITIVVPPAMPAAFTIGIVVAQKRLKNRRIYCTDPEPSNNVSTAGVINVCGAVNLVAFDKTGTLTEDGMTFKCALAVATGLDGHPHNTTHNTSVPWTWSTAHLCRAMASCHTLTLLDGEVAGDPLELTLFAQSGARLIHDDTWPIVVPTNHRACLEEISIVDQYPFSSVNQRATVVVDVYETDTNEAEGQVLRTKYVYVKGAAERILSLCDEATIPYKFSKRMEKFTQSGHRLIAIAGRHLNDDDENAFHSSNSKQYRETIESHLNLYGVVVLENRLKPASEVTVEQLNDASIRTIMITGDHLQTAVSVATQCGILDSRKQVYMVDFDSGTINLEALHGDDNSDRTDVGMLGNQTSVSSSMTTPDEVRLRLLSEETVDLRALKNRLPGVTVITGATLNSILSACPTDIVLHELLRSISVYARMQPGDKAKVLTLLQSHTGYITAMCGDGANDCAALKAAHVGISLSEAEASIASQFTSCTTDISCVPTIISQGRCSLVTAVGIFRYMVGYSLTQFATVLILYSIGTSMSDWQFLYQDLALITVYSALFSLSSASPSLHMRPPSHRVMSVQSFASLIGHALIIAGFQLFMFFYITYMSWFTPFDGDVNVNDFASYQGTVVFQVASYQFVWLALIHNKGRPHRLSLIHNHLLCLALAIGLALTTTIVMAPFQFINELFELIIAPEVSTLRFQCHNMKASFRLLIIVVSVCCLIVQYTYEVIVCDRLAVKIDRWWMEKVM